MKRRGGPNHPVKANPNLVPDRWWEDELLRDEIRRRVRRLRAEGVSTHDVARATGVSSRSVTRITSRRTDDAPPAYRCGSARFLTVYGPAGVRRRKIHGRCTALVSAPGERCRWHR